MAKKIKQFRYYANNSRNNYPTTLKYNQLISGSIFSSYMPII
jgi:hypothetical protein